MPVCVLAADSGRARFFLVTGAPRSRKLTELEDLVSPNARLQRRDLTSGPSRIVMSSARGGSGNRAVMQRSAGADFDPHAADVARFAKRLARRQDERRRLGEFNELRIVAEPRFLGALRASISAPTRRLLSREVSRDLSRATPARIGEAVFSG